MLRSLVTKVIVLYYYLYYHFDVNVTIMIDIYWIWDVLKNMQIKKLQTLIGNKTKETRLQNTQCYLCSWNAINIWLLINIAKVHYSTLSYLWIQLKGIHLSVNECLISWSLDACISIHRRIYKIQHLMVCILKYFLYFLLDFSRWFSTNFISLPRPTIFLYLVCVLQLRKIKIDFHKIQLLFSKF